VDYLRLHLGLPAGEPTPVEVKTAFEAAGVDDPAAEAAHDFLRACDAARFALPAGFPQADLPAKARNLLETLEVGLCALRRR
jgi:hypothetical protein